LPRRGAKQVCRRGGAKAEAPRLPKPGPAIAGKAESCRVIIEAEEASEAMSSEPKRKTSSTSRRPRAPRSAGSGEPTPDSSATKSTNPLELEPDAWRPPEQPTPAQLDPGDDFEPPPPEPLEWSPERGGAIVRAGGFLLHTADGMAREPGGDELWRATEADVDAIAPPLARILNRYEPARRLAGVSDETELAIGLMGYARRNLAERGRLVTAKRQAATAAPADGQPDLFEGRPPVTE
jgi:hypothetical protein